ncbi:MAG: biopolymer transporter ExbD [Bacteroidetes bacterium]|nr:biopolymer transporter ExbD [Bacteroidota bacterium]
MNLRKHLRESSEPHTSALNDILFILLLFFLIISTLANPNVVKVSTPKAKSDTKAKQTVVVSIDSMQRFYVGANLTPPDSLKSVISRMAAKANDAEPTVVINGDKKATWDNIMIAMKAAKAANLKVVAAIDKEGK